MDFKMYNLMLKAALTMCCPEIYLDAVHQWEQPFYFDI